MHIEIYPLEKVKIDTAEIYLGMEQSAVETAIGKGQLLGNRYYYYNCEMAIDYDADMKVKFIEFLGGIDGFLHPIIYGVSAFEVFADSLTSLLTQKNDGEIDDSERGYCYSFLNISVGIYRETTPSAVDEIKKEMEADGIPIENNKDIEIEIRKAKHWSTIGIGVVDYYK